MNEATPVTAPAVPATPSSVPVVPATVILTKEQHDLLVRDAARASGNQRKADLYDKTVGKKNSSHFQPVAPATPPSEEEMEAQAKEEDRKAERGLMTLAVDPAFREVFDADPTLRDLITKNPLAVLPILAPDALDADDALSLVREALGKLVKPKPPVTPPSAPATPPAPPVGVVNTPSDPATNEAVEKARKHPNTEHAVAGMIGAKLLGGKK